jgi:hypothetical protein
MPLQNARSRTKPIVIAARPKVVGPKPPTRTELVNAKKALAGHSKFAADYEAKVKEYSDIVAKLPVTKDSAKEAAELKDLIDTSKAMALTHKNAAAAARNTISRGPKVS